MSAWMSWTKDGAPGWMCADGDCAFWSRSQEGMKEHWATGIHAKPDPLKELEGQLADELARFRRQVQRETAEAMEAAFRGWARAALDSESEKRCNIAASMVRTWIETGARPT